MKKDVPRNLTKFTVKRLCQSLFFHKVVGLRPATLLKKRPWHRCFPVNFVKFLRIHFLQNTSGQLLLTYHPGSQSGQYFFENIDKALDMYSYFDKIILTGDFNAKIHED